MSRDRAIRTAIGLLVCACLLGGSAGLGWAEDAPPAPSFQDFPPPCDPPPPPPPPPIFQPFPPCEGAVVDEQPLQAEPLAPAPPVVDMRVQMPPPVEAPCTEPLTRSCGPCVCRPPMPNCEPCYQPPCRWSLTIAGASTQLSDPEGLVGEPLGVANQLQWDGNDYDPDVGGFLKVAYAWTNTSVTELRVRYWGGFSGGSQQTGVFGFAPGPAASTVLNARLESEADFLGIDLMHWKAFSCCGDNRFLWGAGLTFLNLEEEASFTGTSIAVPVTTASARAEVDNVFYGVQLGLAWFHDFTPGTELGVSARGLLGAIDRDIDVRDSNVLAGGTHAASDSETAFGWGAEVGLSLTQRFTAGFAVTAGYSLQFLGETVRAHDAMDFGQAGTGAVQARQKTDLSIAHQIYFGVVLDL